jgi:hypothetical protein
LRLVGVNLTSFRRWWCLDTPLGEEVLVMSICSVRKQESLRASATLNLHAECVHAPLFHVNPFFDAHDLVQVKYEMLRAVEHDDLCLWHAVRMYGFSRTTWYQIKPSYDRAGLPGLLPRRLKKSWQTALMALKSSRRMSAFENKLSARSA